MLRPLWLSWLAILATVAAQSQDDECMPTINNLALREQFAPTYDVQRYYKLCPGATYNLGTIDFSGRVVGQDFIPLRSNLEIKCGPNGNPDDNCVVRGGDLLLDGTSLFGITHDSVENVVIEGITFIDAGKHLAWVSKRGSITFRNCIFRDNDRTMTPLMFDFYNPDAPAESLQVRFESSSFVNNKFYGSPAQPAVVVGNGQQNHFVFSKAKFTDNDMIFNNTRAARNSYLVETSGPITMVDSCFENNKVLVSPIVHYGRNYVFENNYAGANTFGLKCFFVARFETYDQYDTFSPRCENFDSSICRADETAMPSSFPSAAPTAPTTSPSASPSVSSVPSISMAPSVSAAPTMDPASPTVSTSAPFSTLEPTPTALNPNFNSGNGSGSTTVYLTASLEAAMASLVAAILLL